MTDWLFQTFDTSVAMDSFVQKHLEKTAFASKFLEESAKYNSTRFVILQELAFKHFKITLCKGPMVEARQIDLYSLARIDDISQYFREYLTAVHKTRWVRQEWLVQMLIPPQYLSLRFCDTKPEITHEDKKRIVDLTKACIADDLFFKEFIDSCMAGGQDDKQG